MLPDSLPPARFSIFASTIRPCFASRVSLPQKSKPFTSPCANQSPRWCGWSRDSPGMSSIGKTARHNLAARRTQRMQVRLVGLWPDIELGKRLPLDLDRNILDAMLRDAHLRGQRRSQQHCPNQRLHGNSTPHCDRSGNVRQPHATICRNAPELELPHLDRFCNRRWSRPSATSPSSSASPSRATFRGSTCSCSCWRACSSPPDCAAPMATPNAMAAKSAAPFWVCSLSPCSVSSVGATSSSPGISPPASSAPQAWHDPAPDFTLQDANGKPVTLSDLRRTNRAVLLIFYRGYW